MSDTGRHTSQDPRAADELKQDSNEENMALNERLFDAVAKGQAATAAALLDQGADLAWPNPLAGGQTALAKALEARHEETAALLFGRATKAGLAAAVVEAVRQHARPAWSPAAGDAAAGAPADENESLEARVERALAAFARGEFLVVADNEERENEGDLIVAASAVTPEKMAFMINNTSGIICVATTGQRLEQLELPQMVTNNTEVHSTAFTVTVDYAHGTTTGISASDRAITVRAMADPDARAADFLRPGHIFPLRARPGGVLERGGHTEAAVDLARLAGLPTHAGAISEITRSDGTVARSADLREFSARHGLQMISVDDLVKYRKATGR